MRLIHLNDVGAGVNIEVGGQSEGGIARKLAQLHLISDSRDQPALVERQGGVDAELFAQQLEKDGGIGKSVVLDIFGGKPAEVEITFAELFKILCRTAVGAVVCIGKGITRRDGQAVVPCQTAAFQEQTSRMMLFWF